MVKKFRVSLALQPIATAIFACSPFTEGKPNGFLSMRSEVWRDTDRNRTGMLPFVFEPGMSFERYADYALDVPMYFVYRDGRYIDVAGASFARFPGRDAWPQLPGECPTARRLVGPPHHAVSRGAHEALPGDARRRRRALAAHLRGAGVLDRPALRPHLARCRLGPGQGLDAPRSARRLRDAVPKSALAHAVPRRRRVLEVARAALAIAQAGLQRRARHRTRRGEDESIFLEPVEAILRNGITPAEEMLVRYERDWDRQHRPAVPRVCLLIAGPRRPPPHENAHCVGRRRHVHRQHRLRSGLAAHQPSPRCRRRRRRARSAPSRACAGRSLSWVPTAARSTTSATA